MHDGAILGPASNAGGARVELAHAVRFLTVDDGVESTVRLLASASRNCLLAMRMVVVAWLRARRAASMFASDGSSSMRRRAMRLSFAALVQASDQKGLAEPGLSPLGMAWEAAVWMQLQNHALTALGWLAGSGADCSAISRRMRKVSQFARLRW